MQFDTGDNLVIIRHPQNGDKRNADEIRTQIVHALARCTGNVCFFHDASEMGHSDIEYAKEFRELDWMLSNKVPTSVCLVPVMEPRLLARLISAFSGRKWRIYKDPAKAAKFLSFLGWPANLPGLSGYENVAAYVKCPDGELQCIYPQVPFFP